MKTIKSFTIDHNKHTAGFYKSSYNNNIYTYDLRFKKPNSNDYISNPALHTVEHLFATVIRNSDIEDKVVYFGPMGCRTGFYLLLYGIDYTNAKKITKECMEKCLKLNEVPGASAKECGNYLEHDLEAAKVEIINYLEVLQKSITD